MAHLTVFLDANVLYPAGLRDLLMRLALQGLFQAKWSDAVHEEWMQAVQRDFPHISRAQLERTRDLMNRYAVDSLVTGYEHLVESLNPPDANDRHVLAAAIVGKAARIITFNRKDFPSTALDPYGINVQHPDVLINELLDGNLEGVCAAARQHRLALRNPPKSVADYLASLIGHGLPVTVSRLREHTTLLEEPAAHPQKNG